MTDNQLLILASFFVGFLFEMVCLLFRILVLKQEFANKPFMPFVVHWFASSLILYVIVYIAYRLYFNASP